MDWLLEHGEDPDIDDPLPDAQGSTGVLRHSRIRPEPATRSRLGAGHSGRRRIRRRCAGNVAVLRRVRCARVSAAMTPRQLQQAVPHGGGLRGARAAHPARQLQRKRRGHQAADRGGEAAKDCRAAGATQAETRRAGRRGTGAHTLPAPSHRQSSRDALQQEKSRRLTGKAGADAGRVAVTRGRRWPMPSVCARKPR